MNAPQYVFGNVSSSSFLGWMPYYTHHSDMDAPQYVHYDVASDHNSPGMFYHTLHSNMDAPQYVNFDVPSGNRLIEYFITHSTGICTIHSM